MPRSDYDRLRGRHGAGRDCEAKLTLSNTTNAFDQPVGAPLPEWKPCARPARATLEGRYCRVEPLDAARHAADLFAAYASATDERNWTYLSVGPFREEAEFRHYAERIAASEDPLHFAVVDRATGRAVGTLALMRIDPANGVVEVGFVTFSPALQRTPLSTEAQYLLMKYVFGTLGYRRYEWKCDSLNGPSRKAALRLGFRYEGTFRQAIVYKGRNRDTAWFSIIDGEWPAVAAAFEAWLSPENFDADGAQRQSLIAIRRTQAQARQGARKAATEGAAVSVRALTAADEAAWKPLWQAYLAFYDTTVSETVYTRTWARLMDPAEPMFALGAFDATGRMLGIVHAIYHRSCWTEGPYCYLQDLFTAGDARGRGVGRALIEAVYDAAREAGACRVHWLTHETNARARALYDTLATNPGAIQYRREIT
jgi:RimJ/RimL family protein N-acetyltransferase